MTNRFIGSLLCGGLWMFATVASAQNVSSTVTNGVCSPTKVQYRASALDNSSRTSMIFGNIPEASVSFTQGAAGGCVLVRFSALLFLGYDGVVVRAFLDNVTAALPAEVIYSSVDSTFNTDRVHTFEFIFPSVAPGPHILRMQYRSEGGSSAYVLRHNTIIQFAP